MPAGELISQAEYARRRGVDPTSVRDAIRAGRITLVGGRVDPSAADMQWDRNTRRRVRAIDEKPAANAYIQSPPRTHSAPSDPAPDYNEARARREQAEAELAELKLAEQRGMLVRVEVVKNANARRVSAMREAFLQLPARVVPLLLADTSASAVDAVLKREIHGALQRVLEGGD